MGGIAIKDYAREISLAQASCILYVCVAPPTPVGGWLWGYGGALSVILITPTIISSSYDFVVCVHGGKKC